MSRKGFKVALDIGHGSNTFPSNGKGVRVNGVGYAEHTFNSITAIKMKKMLEDSGIEVVWLQKPYSQDIPLATRTSWYRSQGVDLIISIHANANGNSNVNGRCSFFWHSSSRARNLAREIINQIKAKGYTTHGSGLHESITGSWTNLHMARVPALWSNPVPSVLVEYGFMTGNKDFNLVFGSQQGKYTTDMADATARAVCRFLGVSYKGGSVSVDRPPSNISPSSGKTHTVKSGDTLWAIAQANGVSVEEIKRINNLTSNIIKPSQKLIVKIDSDKKDEVSIVRPETYTIQAGDTLGEVSTEFDVSMENLIKWNNISNPDIIQVGQVIKLRQNATVSIPKPSSSPRFVVGETVRISQSATHYSTGQRIPNSVKNRAYTIMQVTSDRVLLQEIMSWVRRSDIQGGKSNTKPSAPVTSPTSNNIREGSRVVINQSANKYATGENIPNSVKGKTYTVMQLGNGRVLLREIMSWVNTRDVSVAGQSAPAPNRPASFKVGDKVSINQSARTYATGENIPNSRKGVTYTIQQVGNGRLLLREIVSWVRTSDVTKR